MYAHAATAKEKYTNRRAGPKTSKSGLLHLGRNRGV